MSMLACKCVHTHIFSYVTTIKEKEATNFRERKVEEAHGGFGRRKGKGKMIQL